MSCFQILGKSLNYIINTIIKIYLSQHVNAALGSQVKSKLQSQIFKSWTKCLESTNQDVKFYQSVAKHYGLTDVEILLVRESKVLWWAS